MYQPCDLTFIFGDQGQTIADAIYGILGTLLAQVCLFTSELLTHTTTV